MHPLSIEYNWLTTIGGSRWRSISHSRRYVNWWRRKESAIQSWLKLSMRFSALS